MIAKLDGKSIFTVIDMKDGFWQMKLDESSSRLCTVNSPFGWYSMKRLPFGLSSSPEAFQKRNIELFGNISGVHIIFDDIIMAQTVKNIMMIYCKRCLSVLARMA